MDRYLETRTEADRQALRAAYLAVPGHMRQYALGDMDTKDWPLRVLCTQIGERTTHGELVTESMHVQAQEYFEGARATRLETGRTTAQSMARTRHRTPR